MDKESTPVIIPKIAADALREEESFDRIQKGIRRVLRKKGAEEPGMVLKPTQLDVLNKLYHDLTMVEIINFKPKKPGRK